MERDSISFSKTEYQKRYPFLGLAFAVIMVTVISVDATASDCVLELSKTGGYATLLDTDVDDLDYSKDFSVEVIAKIEPHSVGGRWGGLIEKAHNGISLYNPAYPGFAIGIGGGHLEHFGQRIAAKVGDGTNDVELISSYYEGYVYVVMTWNATTKELILYVNGALDSADTNAAIAPADIENEQSLNIGRGLYNLGRDIFMARIWNRKLTAAEVATLSENYDATGQHVCGATHPGSYPRSVAVLDPLWRF